MKILVISSNYPSNRFPNHGAFVYNLLQELAKQHQILIISPFKIHHLLKVSKSSYGRERCDVHRPLYLSLSNIKKFSLDTGNCSFFWYTKAIERTTNKLPYKPDLIYAHFLSNGLSIMRYARKNRIPLVVSSGESSYSAFQQKDKDVQSALMDTVSHVICVSDENRKQLIDCGFDPVKLTVIPNAVDYDVFRPLNKYECKEKLGLSLRKFTVGFVGHFIHRKGPDRVISAIEFLGDPNIQLVCVGGKGSLRNNGFTTEIGPVPNHRLPEIYNAFDVFVLPTLSEGHCNVIEEAKACGVPIISSKGTSVEEQVDDSVGVLVDPLSIDEIAGAIKKLNDNISLREEMVRNLIKIRGANSLRDRARRINDILLRFV